MNTAELIGAVVGLGGLAMQGGFFAFMLGKHSNRLQTVERETADLKTKTDAHGVALAGIEGMMRLLDEVRGDVKKLLIGGGSRRQSGSN